jgi:predicted transcriptional regulator
MQTATAKGLVPSTEENRRYTIKHIHTADDKHDVQGLVDKVSKKTVAEMVSHLMKPDVLVINAKDKDTILPKILKYDEEVI